MGKWVDREQVVDAAAAAQGKPGITPRWCSGAARSSSPRSTSSFRRALSGSMLFSTNRQRNGLGGHHDWDYHTIWYYW